MNLPTDIAPPLMALRYAPGQPEGRSQRDDDDGRGFGNAQIGGGFASSFAASLNQAEGASASEESGLDALLDVINPLQHIPVVSSVYRAATEDDISAPARLLGGALFGGPLGLGLALANVITEEATGSDIGEHVAAALTPETETAPAALAARGRASGPDDVASRGEDGSDTAAAETGTAQLAQYANVKDWAENEARFRAEAARARGTGTHAGLREADAFIENALLSGAMKSVMKEYDQLATNQRRDDHMAMEMDLEG